jgi:hypothetical protein
VTRTPAGGESQVITAGDLLCSVFKMGCSNTAPPCRAGCYWLKHRAVIDHNNGEPTVYPLLLDD